MRVVSADFESAVVTAWQQSPAKFKDIPEDVLKIILGYLSYTGGKGLSQSCRYISLIVSEVRESVSPDPNVLLVVVSQSEIKNRGIIESFVHIRVPGDYQQIALRIKFISEQIRTLNLEFAFPPDIRDYFNLVNAMQSSLINSVIEVFTEENVELTASWQGERLHLNKEINYLGWLKGRSNVTLTVERISLNSTELSQSPTTKAIEHVVGVLLTQPLQSARAGGAEPGIPQRPPAIPQQGAEDSSRRRVMSWISSVFAGVFSWARKCWNSLVSWCRS